MVSFFVSGEFGLSWGAGTGLLPLVT